MSANISKFENTEKCPDTGPQTVHFYLIFSSFHLFQSAQGNKGLLFEEGWKQLKK